jgi:hypothetical protein
MLQVTSVVDSTSDLIFNDQFIVQKKSIVAEKEATRVIITDTFTLQKFECVPSILVAPVVATVDAFFIWLTTALDVLSISDSPYTAGVDAFGRQRVSEPQALHDGKNIFGHDPKFWSYYEDLNGGTNNSSFTGGKMDISISSPIAATSTVIRCLKQVSPYQGGNSQRLFETYIMNVDTTMVTIGQKGTGMTGLGDTFNADGDYGALPDNGLVFVQHVTAAGVQERRFLVRKAGSTIHDIEQASWDDPMDGSGPSGVNVDWSSPQISDCDFEWLGVGTIRFGFNIGRITYYAHTIDNANQVDVSKTPYMDIPNLRPFYGVSGTGDGATGADVNLYQVCSAVQSEAGNIFIGNKRIIRKGALSSGLASGGANFTSILAVRIDGAKIGTVAKYISATISSLITSTWEWVAAINPTYTPGAETWDNLTDSNLEYSADIEQTITPANLGIIIDGGFGSSTNQNRPPSSGERQDDLGLGHAGDSTPDELHILVRPISGTNPTFNAHAGVAETY